MSPAISIELERKQQNDGAVASPKMYAMRSVCNVGVYADNVVTKVCFVRSLPSKDPSKIIANLTSAIVFHCCTTKHKNKSSICKVSCNFLSSSRHFNCATFFAVIVFFVNRSVHSFKSIPNRKVTSGFHVVKVLRT